MRKPPTKIIDTEVIDGTFVPSKKPNWHNIIVLFFAMYFPFMVIWYAAIIIRRLSLDAVGLNVVAVPGFICLWLLWVYCSYHYWTLLKAAWKAASTSK